MQVCSGKCMAKVVPGRSCGVDCGGRLAGLQSFHLNDNKISPNFTNIILNGFKRLKTVLKIVYSEGEKSSLLCDIQLFRAGLFFAIVQQAKSFPVSLDPEFE